MQRFTWRRVVLVAILTWSAVVGSAPVAAGSPSRNQEQRALMRCQHAMSRESVVYGHSVGWRLERCLRTMSDCQLMGGMADNPYCRAAASACRSVIGDATEMASRMHDRVAAACNTIPLDMLKSSLGLAMSLDPDCPVDSLDAMIGCMQAAIDTAQGYLFGRIEGLACPAMLAMGSNSPVPAAMCTAQEVGTGGGGGDPGTCDGLLYCGGAQGVACPDGMMCDRSDSLCSASADGVCVPVPTACAAGGTPVCGCDGTTYPSDCDRLMANIIKAGEGSCAPPAQDCGLGLPECPAGEFCEYPQFLCGEGSSGTCRPLASPGCDVCLAYVAGVQCGCDGVTYANDCARAAAGTSKLLNGPCP